MALLATLVPHSSLAQAPSTPFAPASVWILPSADGEIIVTWAPGVEPADEYRVYGVAPGGQLVFLDAVAGDLLAYADTGYLTYGVSGVLDGVESAPTFAMIGRCVEFILGPPPQLSYGNCQLRILFPIYIPETD